MVKFIKHYFFHTDARGSITGLVQFDQWEEVNHILSVRGTVRGGHYHKEAKELFVILSGKIEVTTRNVKDGRLVEEVDVVVVMTGDVFLVEPFVDHTFKCLEDSEWINLLSKKTDKDRMDIFRPNVA